MAYIGTKPADKPLTAADITDGVITTAKIADGAVVNADIANSTINLTTKVTGTLPTTNGGTGLATIGTAAQVLRVNSGATALEYATPAAGSFTFLAETSASNVASVDLNGYFTSSYDYYQIYIDDIYTANNDSRLRMQFATTGSYTIQTSGYYSSTSIGLNSVSGAAAASEGIWNGTSFATSFSTSSTSTQVSNVIITIYNPMGSNIKTFSSIFCSAYGNITEIGNGSGGGRWNSTTAITGVRFLATTGNMYARKIRMYGIKNS
jgi:hypothetical protein